ncbi:MAG: TVP38/TMEM64 family protein [Syntrophobacteraceae bacterium]
MNTTSSGGGNKALLKASILVAFIVLALLSVRFTQLGDYFSAPSLESLLERAGFWAPFAFILFYAAGICLFIPGTVLTAIGAAIFGPYWGFVYVWAGAMVGSAAAFLIARTLGREFAASLVGEKLKKYDEAIEKNGFATVLYLRLIYFPFTIMNFGMGLTKVRFWDYFFGTALGIFAGTFVLTFLIGTLKEVWASGDWSGLISLRVLFSVALFAVSLLIPKAVKKIRGER